jgi:hypothetical protein
MQRSDDLRRLEGENGTMQKSHLRLGGSARRRGVFFLRFDSKAW